MTLMPFSLAWVALVCVTLSLALYRKFVARKEDDYVHIHETDTPVVVHQFVIARRLDAVDRWGKILTIFTVACGVILAAIYTYQTWTNSLQVHY